MGLIITILLGALVGYLATRIMGRDEGFITSTLFGIGGALLGGWISRLLGLGDQSALAFDLSGLLWSLGGAILVAYIVNKVQKRA